MRQWFPHIDFTWSGCTCMLTAAQVYLVTHFFFLLLLLSLTFFLSARDNETIHDRLTIDNLPSHVRLVLCARELWHSHRQPPVFPIRSFICATISNTSGHQFPHLSHTSATLAQYLATFRTFWWLFFHNEYILTTNLATFFEEKKKP